MYKVVRTRRSSALSRSKALALKKPAVRSSGCEVQETKKIVEEAPSTTATSPVDALSSATSSLSLLSKKSSFASASSGGVSLASTPPSTPSTPTELEQQMEQLHKVWIAFQSGDDVQLYVPRTPSKVPADFRPFRIERLLLEQIIQEVDIDPALVDDLYA